MPHLIPQNLIATLTAGPTPRKTTQVSNMQSYIQELLGDTHHTFLQGSYKNDTAISDINDVDIVAIRTQTYSGTHSRNLTPRPVIMWDTIFTELESKLRAQSRYTWTVQRGDKCIKIRGAFNADVVPAVKVLDDHTLDPMVIFSFQDGIERKNWPRTHHDNGVEKNRLTSGHYKPTVRMFKNWAINHFGDDKVTISSHKIGALVYGAPDNLFDADYAANFIRVGYHILETLRKSGVIPSVCGYEDIAANWNSVGRSNFVNQLADSVNRAYEAYQASTQQVAEQKWRLAFNI